MEDQLVTGQWVEILGEGSTARLCGFVLSLRPLEMLLTFPDLPLPPAWLEAGSNVRVEYSSRAGRHAGQVPILRVAVGPPLSVVSGRLGQVATEQRRRARRLAITLPVLAKVLSSGIPGNKGREEKRARTQNVSAMGILLETSLKVMVGDVLELTIPFPGAAGIAWAKPFLLPGRVVRVEAMPRSPKSIYRVAVEIEPGDEEARLAWAHFAEEIARNEEG